MAAASGDLCTYLKAYSVFVDNRLQIEGTAIPGRKPMLAKTRSNSTAKKALEVPLMMGTERD
jgi:hypothetical protein